ncbi:TetR/AcrR family transcriptional regulator [Staphylococcus coagulans]|uniref:TetR/AcrR family transcriptional regulator n=1 Tax=Staphylococcus coagulans TaxID=74706 RepID=UPI0015F9AD60|nr:TetR/AcrR family transcriptional regulator [Staphylococcus coagulans]MBA8762617.1 TetR family transcriptional regulator [Staphylococcus coagulans]
MTSKETTKRLDARRNEKLILETASKMMSGNTDIRSISMATIADEANVGVGTLYRHFESKSMLCRAVIDDQIDDMFADIEAFLAQNEDASLHDRLYGVLEIFLNLKERNLKLLNFIEKSGIKANATNTAPFYDDLYQVIQREMEKSGNIDNMELKIDMLLNAFSSDIYMYERFTRGYTIDAYLQNLLEIYLK